MRLRSIDVRCRGRTIADAGGEDRALLRSNPSAHAGAGTRAGVCLHGSPPPSPTRSGHKATNLGVCGRAPRQHPGLVGHMSRLPGWTSLEVVTAPHQAHVTTVGVPDGRPISAYSSFCEPFKAETRVDAVSFRARPSRPICRGKTGGLAHLSQCSPPAGPHISVSAFAGNADHVRLAPRSRRLASRFMPREAPDGLREPAMQGVGACVTHYYWR